MFFSVIAAWLILGWPAQRFTLALAWPTEAVKTENGKLKTGRASKTWEVQISKHRSKNTDQNASSEITRTPILSSAAQEPRPARGQ